MKLDKRKAYDIYDRILSVLEELVKIGCDLDRVDAIRIADDAADYRGPLYQGSSSKKNIIRPREQLRIAKNRGKYTILHCDGNLMKAYMALKLTKIYDGLRPLDLMPKPAVKAAIRWIMEVIRLREIVGWNTVFFTGIPIDLVFNNYVEAQEFVKILLSLLEEHGLKRLVLSTTHSEYPGRSYNEPRVRIKIDILKRGFPL